MQKFVFTDADHSALNAQAGHMLLRIVLAQGAMGLAAAVMVGIFAGPMAGLSALAGAGVYLLPNALFALRLLITLFKTRRASPYFFLLVKCSSCS